MRELLFRAYITRTIYVEKMFSKTKMIILC